MCHPRRRTRARARRIPGHVRLFAIAAAAAIDAAVAAASIRQVVEESRRRKRKEEDDGVAMDERMEESRRTGARGWLDDDGDVVHCMNEEK